MGTKHSFPVYGQLWCSGWLHRGARLQGEDGGGGVFEGFEGFEGEGEGFEGEDEGDLKAQR